MWKIFALPVIEKIIALLMVRKTLSSLPLVHKLWSGAVIILFLALVAMLLVTSLVLAGFYGEYLLLMASGLSPLPSVLITVFTVALLIAALLRIIYLHVQKMKILLEQIVKNQEAPAAYDIRNIKTNISAVGKSFMNGLRSSSSPKE
jgi:hypothetical protein